ncbi:helix-turn-helix transcriptional regulator [Bacillus sp. T_4]|nr:helix-turn-helix transcriptional regulator [Bacillus sp. T_4]
MIGDRLKKLRDKHTQEDIAQYLGISRSRYSHYENERSEPDNKTLNKLADFFDVSTDYLLGREGECDTKKNKTKHQTELIPPLLDSFFQELKEAPKEQQELLIKFWDVIKSEYSIKNN